jgi:hypothetical protein
LTGRSVTEGERIEPINILQNIPSGNPDILQYRVMNDERLNSLIQSFGSLDEVKKSLDVYLSIPKRIFESIVPAPLVAQIVPETQRIENGSNIIQPEYTVTAIETRRFSEEHQCYLWRTVWGSGNRYNIQL